MTSSKRIACAMALCVSCTTTPPPSPKPVYIEAQPPVPKPVPPKIVGVPYPKPTPGQAIPWPKESAPTPKAIKAAKRKKLTPKQVIEEANQRARSEPTPEGFSNAALVYDYMPDRLYGAWGAPNHLTSIVFAPGEEVISYGLGDTVRWISEKTYAGTGARRRTLIVLEPRMRGLHTTMIVTTSFDHVYRFELRSFQHTFLASVRFEHPRRRFLQMARERAASLEQRAVPGRGRSDGKPGELELAVDLSKIEDRYHFIVADKSEPPRWIPRRVFHDGRRTYLVFDHDLGERELPVVAVYSRDKRARLIQTALRGRYLIVGEVVERGVLRMGKESRDTVGFELKKGAKR